MVRTLSSKIPKRREFDRYLKGLREVAEGEDGTESDPIAKYLEGNGMRCPRCGAANVRWGQISATGGGEHIEAERECGGCGATWRDMMRLVGYEGIGL